MMLCTVFTTMVMAAAPAPFTLSGTIKGLPEGTKLILVPGATHSDEKPVAKATVIKGKFTFKGTVSSPRLFYIQAEAFPGAGAVMVQSAHITVNGTAKLTGDAGSQYYDFGDFKVKGSDAHTLYLKKKAPKAMLDSLFMANQEANKEVTGKRNEAYKMKDTVLAKSIMASEAWKKLESDEGAFFKLAGETLKKVVSDNKNTWWGPFFALDLYNYFTPEDKAMYAQFSPQAKESYYGKVLGELINPVGFKGTAAPLAEVKTESGSSPQLASLIKGHKYVLVDFWASWCVPCRKSIPKLKEVYAEFKDKGLQVISISIDKKEGDWVKAQAEEKLPWPSVLDKGATANAWKIQAIPAMFLLDEKGVVVAENLSLEEIVAKLKAI
ncbi:redoxin domain-containing protein [Pedobacter sp. AW31-3R]|uniref:redoxin domain-containing protein n=1 Tax=Pedobacter sp. AW31-3R TaxID=3445781 RepID=UPI003F9F7116